MALANGVMFGGYAFQYAVDYAAVPFCATNMTGRLERGLADEHFDGQCSALRSIVTTFG